MNHSHRTAGTAAVVECLANSPWSRPGALYANQRRIKYANVAWWIVLGTAVEALLLLVAVSCAFAGGTFQVIPGLDGPTPRPTPYISESAVAAEPTRHQIAAPYHYQQEELEALERCERRESRRLERGLRRDTRQFRGRAHHYGGQRGAIPPVSAAPIRPSARLPSKWDSAK